MIELFDLLAAPPTFRWPPLVQPTTYRGRRFPRRGIRQDRASRPELLRPKAIIALQPDFDGEPFDTWQVPQD